MKAKIYTKTGDKGMTSLVGGARVAKTDPRLEAYGTLDELNSVLGIVRGLLATLRDAQLRPSLELSLQRIQNQLFNIGSHLACESQAMRASLPPLKAEALTQLESEMDRWESELPPLKNFILPGGSALAAHCHLARTVCRRAERRTIQLSHSAEVSPEPIIYLNRLSDWLFTLARLCNHSFQIADLAWTKD